MADGPSLVTHWCVLLVFFASFFDVAVNLDLSCVEVKKEYVKMGFRDDHNVPISVITGNHLQICPQGSTCCTADMESKLKSLSMKEYETLADEAFKIIKSTFVSRTKKFDEFFTELLANSKKDLHTMFVRTYGLLYQQHAEVFSDLFADLKQYYKGSNLDLVDILNKFFRNLLQRMFELMNGQYVFDQDYLNCVTRHMDDLKPFGDVPQKLKVQVKRAFIASRTFVQGLAIGRDVILAMEMVKPTEACTRGMTRMMYCPYCQGLTRTKPCNNYCLNTMKGCLAHHSELNKAWNEYIEALKMVAQRLEGPFNIETVVDPMSVKISEAIMNFQEDSPTVTEKIFKGCGTPRRNTNYNNGRKKREDTSYEDFAYGPDFKDFKNGGRSGDGKETAAGTNLDRLVRDIKDKIEEAKNFWVQLPYTICNGEIAAQQGEDEDCWNGQDRAKYIHEVQKDGRIYQVNNPEVTVDVQEDNGIISVQIYNLKLITTKLHNAYNGMDVEWNIPDIDIDASGDGDLEGSGRKETGDRYEASGDYEDLSSGSGSGRGYGDDEDSGDIGGHYDPGSYPGGSPTRHPRPGHGDRPSGTQRPPDGGISFTDPNNPIYNVDNKKPNGGKGDPPSGASFVSSSALVIVSSLFMVLRIVL